MSYAFRARKRRQKKQLRDAEKAPNYEIFAQKAAQYLKDWPRATKRPTYGRRAGMDLPHAR